jgi:O-antigen/teichoic acid export membrane protein
LLTAIGANYLLVPQYGADGAAIATAISFWVFLVLRTELAILAWRPLPRLKIYGWTLACLTGAVAFVALGSQYTVFFFTQWLILLSVVSVLGVGFFFRHFKPSANNDATQNQP